VPTGLGLLETASLQEALFWCETERSGLAAATRLAAQSGLHALAWKLPAAAMSFYYRRCHWDDWVATHQVGLASAGTLGDRYAEAWMLNSLGIAYGARHMQEAIGYFQQSLVLCRENGSKLREGRASGNLANTYLDLRMYDSAQQAAVEALGINRRAGDRFGEGIALEVLGCAYRELGRADEAVDHLQQALAIYRELSDHAPAADTLSELGETYRKLGQVTDAITCLRESLNIQREIDDRRHLAVTLERLGRCQVMAGDHSDARNTLTEAFRLWEELGEKSHAAEARAALAALI
jgi:tetratricopeptide (TPR) repeat protein